MQPFGPITLTAGAISEVDVGNNVDRVYIGNDSPYDILVSFAASTPPVVSAATAPWVAWVQSKQGWTIPVAADLNGFSGRLWLLPLNTRNATQALNGTIPSTANAIIQALLPGEPEPPAAAYQDQITLASQPRVIAVPMTAQSISAVVGTVAVNGMIVPVGGTVAVSPFASAVVCYLYSISCQNLATTVNWAEWETGFAEYNNVSALIATHPVHTFVVTGLIPASGASSVPPYQLIPSAPIALTVTPNASTFTFQWYLKLLASQASNQTGIIYNVQVDVDNLNGMKVPPIGGGGNKTIKLVTPTTIF